MRRRLTRLAAIGIGTIAVALAAIVALVRNPGAGADTAGRAGDGARLYRDLGCPACHGIGGGGGGRLSLAGIGARRDPADIRQGIVGAGGPHRSRYERTPAAEIDAVVVYLLSLGAP